MIPAARYRLFQAEELLPRAWRDLAARGPVRAFNPGLLEDGQGWLLAYRIVGADELRRIALCRLDAECRVRPGSAVPFSDLVAFRPGYSARATGWFADPRLFWLGGRAWVYWNSGWHEPSNHQFLQELDPRTLSPIGRARELVIDGRRQALEKNWMFLEGPEPAGVYSIDPHVTMRVELEGEGPVRCERMPAIDWDTTAFSNRFGPLRGGAPPQRVGEHYYSFCHSVFGPVGEYRYVAGVYRFEASPPFRPADVPIEPLPLPNPFGPGRRHERLNPVVVEAVYPCGAARAGPNWLVSYGINDETCAIAFLDESEVAACMGGMGTDT